MKKKHIKRKNYRAGVAIILMILASIAFGYGVDINKMVLVAPGCVTAGIGFLLFITTTPDLLDCKDQNGKTNA